MENLKVFMGSSNRPLGREICKHIGIAPGKLSIKRFSNDNIFVQIEESVRAKDCFVVQSLYPDPNEALVELMIIVDALRSASAERITAVIPHYSYARSDKKDQPRISIAARLFADTLVTAGAMRFMLMNLHSEQVRGFFSVPADHLLSEPIITDYLSENFDLSNTVALLDLGQQKREGNFFRRLGLPLAILNKERKSDHEVEITNMIGEVEGKDVLMFEDEICRGTSLVAAARAVRQRGGRASTGSVHTRAFLWARNRPYPRQRNRGNRDHRLRAHSRGACVAEHDRPVGGFAFWRGDPQNTFRRVGQRAFQIVYRANSIIRIMVHSVFQEGMQK